MSETHFFFLVHWLIVPSFLSLDLCCLQKYLTIGSEQVNAFQKIIRLGTIDSQIITVAEVDEK